MKLEQMVCCAWHSPKNSIVELKTGKLVPERILNGIPSGNEKDLMMESGGMCNPCAIGFAKRFSKAPEEEDIRRMIEGVQQSE